MRSLDDAPPFGHHAPRGSLARVLRLTRHNAKSWIGRRLSFVFRTAGIALLHGRPLDVDALGARMRLYPANNVSEKNLLFTPHLFDPEERQELAKHITSGFTFVDIGANVGGYSLFVAALAGANARILAIEPHPDVFQRLIYNVRQNPFGTVKALECAVTDKDGTITLFVDPMNSGESSVRFVTGSAEALAVQVTTKTLKRVLAEEGFDRLDALKVDVEGAEELILEPFFRDVGKHLWPRLLIIDSQPGREPLNIPALADGTEYREILRTRSNTLYLRSTDPFSSKS